MIKALTKKDLGQWVYYRKGSLEEERGKIKSFSDLSGTAFVVYKANGNWDLDHWKDYTAAATSYKDLTF